MSPVVTRASLLSRVRDATDQAAWAEFDGRYRELIFRYCRRCGLETADAEDVRQLVMLRLMRVLPSFQYDPSTGRFHDYLYRVVRSSIADFKTCPAGRDIAVVDKEAAARAGVGSGAADRADDVWEQEWLDHHLRMAMESVRSETEPRNISIFERLLEGASVEVVAQQFEMTTDAVHKVKQRVRDRVQERISDQIREEDGECR